MKEKAFYRRLVHRYMKNTATDEELEVFFHLQEQGLLDEYIIAYMDQHMISTDKEMPAKHRVPGKMWIAAAVLGAILLAGSSIFLLMQNKGHQPDKLAVKQAGKQQDIAPGGDNAVLTLSDGSVITLDSAGAGAISVQGNTTVLKQSGGKLAYQATGMASTQTIQYNTLTTPRGGKYEVMLPDGTTVLLNAASSLRFPTAFPDRNREVMLSGEAYFEVAKNASQPFRVKLQSQSGTGPERVVEVLGTSFNIMAYQDESVIKTTLVTGSVRVTSEGTAALLSPGQQAVMDKASPERIDVKKTGIEEAIAWKNNEFYFSNTDIYSIMRQISRWYNVDVRYEDSLQVFLNGNIQKSVPASQVFKMLELTGEVRFRTAGREVTVSAK